MDYFARLVVGLPQAEPCVAINHQLRDGAYVAATTRLRVGSLFARDHNPRLGWIRSISAFHRDIPMARLCAGRNRLVRGAYPGIRWRHVVRGSVLTPYVWWSCLWVALVLALWLASESPEAAKDRADCRVAVYYTWAESIGVHLDIVMESLHSSRRAEWYRLYRRSSDHVVDSGPTWG